MTDTPKKKWAVAYVYVPDGIENGQMASLGMEWVLAGNVAEAIGSALIYAKQKHGDKVTFAGWLPEEVPEMDDQGARV